MEINYPRISTVFVCHDGQGNILFSKRSLNCRDEKGKWDVGGGLLEYGLTLKQNLCKELLEEYGCKAKEIRFIGYLDRILENENKPCSHWVAMYFLVQIDRNEVKIQEPENIDEIKWVSFGDWPEPLHSALPRFFEKYAKNISDLLNI